jgi:hypothetical protein
MPQICLRLPAWRHQLTAASFAHGMQRIAVVASRRPIMNHRPKVHLQNAAIGKLNWREIDSRKKAQEAQNNPKTQLAHPFCALCASLWPYPLEKNCQNEAPKGKNGRDYDLEKKEGEKRGS